MKVYVAVFLMVAWALILETDCIPRRGRKYYGNRRRARRYRRRYCQRIDCSVSHWSTWGHCSHDCGSAGSQSRTRQVLRPAKCGGKSCPALRETKACNRMCYNGGTPQPGHCKCFPGFTGKCCEHGSSGYGFCASKPDGLYANPKDCATFYHCSHRITHLKNCPSNLLWNDKSKSCDWPTNVKCGQETGCVWKKWSQWTKCSAPCGCGTHKRTRQCDCSHGNSYKRHGYYEKRCYGNSAEERKCNCHDCSGPNVKIAPIGCFADKDDPERALPDYVAHFLGGTPAVHKIQSCAHLAKRLKVKYFGMQDGDECWVDKKGLNLYNKHGKSIKCKDGLGGSWANSVYKILS